MSGLALIMRAMPELPVLPSVPTCPAGRRISGACMSQQGVVCGVVLRDVQKASGVGMSPQELAEIQHDHENASVYLNLKSDPKTVTGFCHGNALPVLHDGDGQARASYTYCSTWQAEKDRIARGDSELVHELEPEPVSMGIDEPDGDPWMRARRDLDELAPPSFA